MKKIFSPLASFIVAVAATSAVSFIALWQIFNGVPCDNLGVRILGIAGLVTGAVIIGAGINVFALISSRDAEQRNEHRLKEAERHRRRAEELYSSVHGRLLPLLYDGLEEIVSRRAKSLLANLAAQLNCERDLKFYVFAQVGDHLRIVASTVSRNAPEWHISLELGSGHVGYCFSHRKVIIADGLAVHSTIYNRYVQSIGRQESIDETTLEACDPEVKWVILMPIYKPYKSPYSDVVIGVLSVDTTEGGDIVLFKSLEFQKEILDITADVAPYLTVFHKLMQENVNQLGW